MKGGIVVNTGVRGIVRFVVYVDGLAEPKNPGVGTFGYVIYEDGRKVAEVAEFVGENVTNNYAEYSALVAAFRELLRRGFTYDVLVNSDSKLLVNQMAGEWKRKRGRYLEKYLEARDLAKQFTQLAFRWVPREENREADRLSRRAYEKYCRARGIPVSYRQ